MNIFPIVIAIALLLMTAVWFFGIFEHFRDKHLYANGFHKADGGYWQEIWSDVHALNQFECEVCKRKVYVYNPRLAKRQEFLLVVGTFLIVACWGLVIFLIFTPR
jgi:hypothetical protein